MAEVEVALGTKLFSREKKLQKLLDSVPEDIISTVYVADDGDEDNRPLFDNEYPFDFVVLDLEYDAGLGAGRKAIVDACDQDYLLIVDTDHEVPDNVDALVDILNERPEYGGVSGIVNENGDKSTLLHDFEEHGDVLLRTISGDKEEQTAAGRNFIEFDFLPNAAMFRMECLEDYCWDPFYVIEREHIDFYVGHWRETDWKFACCFEVEFPHHPGGSSFYLQNRESFNKFIRSNDYFLEKWGYSTILGVKDWMGMMSGDKPFSPLPTPPLPVEWQAKASIFRRELKRKYFEVTSLLGDPQ